MARPPLPPAQARHRDLLQTAVVLGLLLTPAWLLPVPASRAWQAVVLVLAGPALWFTWHHAPWVPTPRHELDRLVAALDVGPGDRVVDLGAGDGRVVRALAERTGAEAVGVEATPLWWLLAQLRTAGQPLATVHLGDLYRTDLSEADAVYVWGTASSVGTSAFEDHLRSTARPGTRVVSYSTALATWSPGVVDRAGERPMFVYTVPEP